MTRTAPVDDSDKSSDCSSCYHTQKEVRPKEWMSLQKAEYLIKNLIAENSVINPLVKKV
jgi:hypothetical protein